MVCTVPYSHLIIINRNIWKWRSSLDDQQLVTGYNEPLNFQVPRHIVPDDYIIVMTPIADNNNMCTASPNPTSALDCAWLCMVGGHAHCRDRKGGGLEKRHEGHNGRLDIKKDGSCTPHFADSLLISYSGAVQ